MSEYTQITLRNKRITFLDTDIAIGSFLKSGTYWDEWMLKYFKLFYKPNTNMLDIGAHIGTNSLLMSEVISNECLIYSFEPLYDDICEKNIKDNNKEDIIKLFKCGLGEDNYKINKPIINRKEKNNFGGVSIAFFHDGYRKEYPENIEKIEVKTLDNFVLENISLIKLDVEGYELNVLRGATETLCKSNFPVIIIELWEDEGWRGETEKLSQYYQNKKKEIILYLERLGYLISRCNESYWDYICIHKFDNISLDKMFDWKFYISKYNDLQKNGIDKEEDAFQHWKLYGKEQGRLGFNIISSKISTLFENGGDATKDDTISINNPNTIDDFDWIAYINNYEDLQKDGINTKQKAWIHWTIHGKKEGRSCHI